MPNLVGTTSLGRSIDSGCVFSRPGPSNGRRKCLYWIKNQQHFRASADSVMRATSQAWSDPLSHGQLPPYSSVIFVRSLDFVFTMDHGTSTRQRLKEVQAAEDVLPLLNSNSPSDPSDMKEGFILTPPYPVQPMTMPTGDILIIICIL